MEETLVYREEVLTIMVLLGDIRQELVEIHELLQEEEDGEAEADA